VPKINTSRGYPWSDEVDTFWDWALLELLVQSGLRIEEASELTTLDILKRALADGRIYYRFTLSHRSSIALVSFRLAMGLVESWPKSFAM
jgi:hypothetical protein